MFAVLFNLIFRTPVRSEISVEFDDFELFHRFSHPVEAAVFASGSAMELESSVDSG
jgi:hypothetical protein